MLVERVLVIGMLVPSSTQKYKILVPEIFMQEMFILKVYFLKLLAIVVLILRLLVLEVLVPSSTWEYICNLFKS